MFKSKKKRALLDPQPQRCQEIWEGLILLILLQQILDIPGDILPEIIDGINDTIEGLYQTLYCICMIHSNLAESNNQTLLDLELQMIISFLIKRPRKNHSTPRLLDLGYPLLRFIGSKNIINCGNFIITENNCGLHKATLTFL